MADNSRKVLSIKFVADGIADVQKQIEELGKAGSDAAKTIADAFAKTKIGAALSAQLDVLNRRFADVAAAGQAFGSSFTNVQRNLSAFTGAIQNSISRILQFKAALALATAGVAALFKSFGNNAEKITQTASALGVTTDQYQRLSAAAKDVGIEQGALDRILAKFTIGVEDAGDKADEASEKTKKLSGSLEQLAVKAEDGSTKIVTIRRGITDAGKEAEKFSGITQTGVEGLLAYAKALDGAGSASEKLAKAAKDFGSKNALQAVLFFENLTFQFDENKRAAAGLIKPLTDLELLVGNRLDQAFDNLGTNLSLIKDRLLAVFAPAVTKVVESFTKLIQKNETQLVAWATTLNEYVLQIVQDFIAIMSGDLQNVSADNKWLVDLVTGVQEFGAAISYVFTEVVPAAFRTLREYANQAAGYINAVFGTDFTGDSLLIVIALGYVTGAFSILTTGITLAISVIGLAVNAFGLLGASIGLVTGFLKPLAFAIGYVGAALAAIIGAPAWVGIAIVAALAAAGALIYAYWDEIAAYASATWDSIVATASSAISAIANDFSKISTEWSAIFSKLGAGDLKGAFDEIYNQSVAFWSKLLANTQNDIRLINEALKAIGIDLPAVWTAISDGASAAWDGVIEGASSLGTRLSPIWESVKASAASLWSGVEATARTIWNNVASIISSAASGIAEAVGAVWTAASTAISGATAGVAETADSILNSISQALAMAGSIQGAIDLAASLVAPFSAAKDQIIAVWDQLRPALEAKGAEIVAALATPLAELKSLPTAFSEAANAIPGTLSAVIPSAEASMLALSEIILVSFATWPRRSTKRWGRLVPSSISTASSKPSDRRRSPSPKSGRSG